ncbi:type II toxin-antitoxin system RelE family toxin [Dellaglioa carnosa]|uniref:Type II toxin-antitoxin system RelE/ParE family toxin n=1 Tax=Dellaglioa carnosa TaxID=2995136 RepID=A0ABT4JNH1_9LACO|nr:type II toxin-antitoxin system RelE/ParE family toxin [Dellaglioa carnosa]MCZ2491908.1 type II toxin-antitoxin system RelE/ParE family toxin [Dellaglioa carnosa]MCZ2495059.1 type II toxin-antitoxin system RelE/ParE family toxin [Dellaglioa carnosa]MDK1731922.1 type II toxin-antitoxin system RelE/ParE family toxin [Dellaglioa carnosa]
MSKYELRFSDKASKNLKKLDKHQAKLIRDWLYINVDGTEDPYSHGKGLTSNLSGLLWRYRVGDYRVICEIEDDILIVTVINIGHRKQIY